MAGDWTEADLPDLAGRTVVVTGANGGVGYEATRALAGSGATVIMACRSVARGGSARERIEERVAGADLEVRACDLADLDSVRSFAESVRADYDELHALCNNAGVMAIPRRETVDGFERQLGVNHLGHFALAGHLLDRLRAADGGARVVTQSSWFHRLGTIAFEDLQRESSYGKWRAYAGSKLANLLFAYELDRRLDAAGAEVASVGCHPGYADTDLQRRGPEMSGSTIRLWGARLANALFAQPPAAGALPMLDAVTSEDVEGGDYVGPGGLLNMRGHPEHQQSSSQSYDVEAARRLWEVSEELTGVEYDLPEPDG